MFLPSHLRRHRLPRRGSVIIIVLGTVVVLLGMAVMMVDLGYLTAVKSRVQSAADAASMAGALRLRSEYDDPHISDINALAIQFAELNQPSITGVLAASDIEIGEWDVASTSFSTGASHNNAVRVKVRRNNSQSSAVHFSFAQVFGNAESSMNVTSICAFEVHEDEDGNRPMTRPFLVQ